MWLSAVAAKQASAVVEPVDVEKPLANHEELALSKAWKAQQDWGAHQGNAALSQPARPPVSRIC